MNARTENQKPVRWISLYNFAVKQSSDFHFQNSKTFFGKTFKTFSRETSGNRLRAKRTLDQPVTVSDSSGVTQLRHFGGLC